MRSFIPTPYRLTNYTYYFDGLSSASAVREWPCIVLTEDWYIRGWEMFGPGSESGTLYVTLSASTFATYPEAVELLTPSLRGGGKNRSQDMGGAVSERLTAGTIITVVVTNWSTIRWAVLNLQLGRQP